ncbi:hypothetical protein BUALT_Bualt10G0100600 [Buddleja alternifolia]|uniref:C2 tensin-type domain-containing protein n=1 Tax=Buddleja alternifolia TaxID=168488 RepID=A0AAV6WZ88_9LAMI|nr:hypothetical protein BUALT_Bualt10G0100600 [Buddleja alternifolia]
MALFRKIFYRKLPEGLLEISERVFVFDSCFTTNAMEDNEYQLCTRGVVDKLRDHFPDASFNVYNFGDEVQQSHIANTLSEYSITVVNYPCHYENSPLLNLEMIHDFLRSSENWISNGPRNVLLMHCQRGAFPLLAFILAAFLIHSKQYNGEEKTLDMIYKHAPREIVKSLSPLNPLPSQLRYLQYVSKRNMGSEWKVLDRAVKLDLVILRNIPDMDGEGGFRPLFRIYGPDPLMVSDRTAKVIFSTPKTNREVGYFKQVVFYNFF